MCWGELTDCLIGMRYGRRRRSRRVGSAVLYDGHARATRTSDMYFSAADTVSLPRETLQGNVGNARHAVSLATTQV